VLYLAPGRSTFLRAESALIPATTRRSRSNPKLAKEPQNEEKERMNRTSPTRRDSWLAAIPSFSLYEDRPNCETIKIINPAIDWVSTTTKTSGSAFVAEASWMAHCFRENLDEGEKQKIVKVGSHRLGRRDSRE
jgi:hypothetical protein